MKILSYKNTNKLKNSARFVLLLLISINSYAQYGGAAAVKVAKVTQVMMAPVRKIPAIVKAKYTATIKAESKGVVTQLADAGSFIKHGQVIAELSDSQSLLRAQELNDAVQSASARFDFLKSENSRLKDLVSKKVISQSELEQNHANFLSAKSDLAQAKSRLNQYQEQVKKLTIIAPFDGSVLQQFAQPGQLLNPGDKVIEFMQRGQLEVLVNVPVKYKNTIKSQAKWIVTTQSGERITATINNFIQAATGSSRSIEVRLALAENTLWAGEAVTVLVPTQVKKKVMAVPRDALVIRKNGSYVFVVKDDKAHKVEVKIGIAQEDLIEVVAKLSFDDVVVIRGNERLRPQSKVKIIEH